MLRRYWSFWLVVVCWCAVLVVPGTRRGFVAAGSNRYGSEEMRESSVYFQSDIATDLNGPSNDELTARFPANPDVAIYTATTSADFETLSRRNLGSAFIVAIQLRHKLKSLKNDRINGPLNNPDYPSPFKGDAGIQSRRTSWDQFIHLARSGGSLEPDNTYFDWMLLYGLYATRQDDTARYVLHRAAQKSNYDSHIRESILNRRAVWRLAYGSPLSPLEQYSCYSTPDLADLSTTRATMRWIMEDVIEDRSHGRHRQAVDAAFDAMKLGRILRRHSYTIIDSLVGRADEAIALANVTLPKKPVALRKLRFSASLSTFQKHPFMLYSYAKAQGRSDLTPEISKEWVELGQWQKARWIDDKYWTGTPTSQIIGIVAGERLAALILSALPALIVLHILSSVLAWRFKDASVDGNLRKATLRGGLFLCLLLWCSALVADSTLAMRTDAAYGETLFMYMGAEGLLHMASTCVYLGFAVVAICFALNQMVAWQSTQGLPRIALEKRLSRLFDAPDDGLSRFDATPVLVLIGRLTGWLILICGGAIYCFYATAQVPMWSDITRNATGAILPVVFIVSLSAHALAWRSRPHKRAAFRMSFALVADATWAFIVASTVLYTIVAFATLPFAISFDHNFEKSIQKGELAIARARLGL